MHRRESALRHLVFVLDVDEIFAEVGLVDAKLGVWLPCNWIDGEQILDNAKHHDISIRIVRLAECVRHLLTFQHHDDIAYHPPKHLFGVWCIIENRLYKVVWLHPSNAFHRMCGIGPIERLFCLWDNALPTRAVKTSTKPNKFKFGGLCGADTYCCTRDARGWLFSQVERLCKRAWCIALWWWTLPFSRGSRVFEVVHNRLTSLLKGLPHHVWKLINRHLEPRLEVF